MGALGRWAYLSCFTLRSLLITICERRDHRELEHESFGDDGRYDGEMILSYLDLLF